VTNARTIRCNASEVAAEQRIVHEIPGEVRNGGDEAVLIRLMTTTRQSAASEA
jgi:hypothetical protein